MKKSHKTILCPVDFSPASESVLQYFSDIRSVGAELIILHVADPETGDRDSLMKEYLHTFSHYSDRLSLHHCRLRFAVEYGDPASAIIGYACKNAIDLIVMGSHGSTGFTRLLVGSTTETVMRQAKCPVMVLKTPERHEDGALTAPAGNAVSSNIND
jgi:universal stress protein A